MRITGITAQRRNPDRINIMVDGAYAFSVTTSQFIELGLKVGLEMTEDTLLMYQEESLFGKLYMRALEYSLVRPRSRKEMKDYLYRRVQRINQKEQSDGAGKITELSMMDRVIERLEAKKYVNDTTFAMYWVEQRNLRKGISRRKLEAELRAKGIDGDIIAQCLSVSNRDEHDELHKMIAKKRAKYSDEQKLIAYLARQGFGYDDIKAALGSSGSAYD